MKKIITISAVGALLLSASVVGVSAKKWFPFEVEIWNEPFNMNSKRTIKQYEALPKASKKWNICVSVPHLKDSYWTALNYGIVEEAKRLGVKMNLVSAGSYRNLAKQIEQINNCVAFGADAVIVGAISYNGLNKTIEKVRSEGIPVIDLVNGMSSPKVSAKVMVSFSDMAGTIGSHLAKKHSTGKNNVAWFPGPSGAGWAEAANTGFKKSIKGSNVNIVATRYGNTDKKTQKRLINDVLDANPNIDHIVGTAVTADAAFEVLKERKKSKKIEVMSYYFTPEILNHLKKGHVAAAPTDSTVVQGRIAIDQAVRILEKKPYDKHVGPKIYVINKKNIKKFDRDLSLAKKGYKAVFRVK